MSARGVSARWRVIGPLAALPFGAVWAAARASAQEFPDENSADAGFAYDMIRHHAQAVEMAMILYKRTDDEILSVMAYDIALTQQAQIGMMTGWLDVWGLPRTSTQPAMTWMGHPIDGPMPGMATSEEVASLRELPLDEMVTEFLQLMIAHHLGGVLMAEAGESLLETDPARELAATIVATQRAEIDQMQQMLVERGVSSDSGDDDSMSMEGHDHEHGGDDEAPATPTP